MADRLPAPPEQPPSLSEDFDGAPDPALWVTSYLPQWTTPERAGARFDVGDDGLVLRIDAGQPDWRPEDAPLRVSNLQTGSFSGPAGSTPDPAPPVGPREQGSKPMAMTD